MDTSRHLKKYFCDEGHCVIELPDRVEYETVHELETELRSLLFQCGDVPVLLDFSTCAYINSSGLRLIITLKNYTQEKKIPMALVSPNYHIRQLLEITSINQMVTIFDTLDEARLRI